MFFLLPLLLTAPFSLKAEEPAFPPFLSQSGAGGASFEEGFHYLINPAAMGFQKQNKGLIAYSFKKRQKTALVSFLDLKTQFPLAISWQRFWSGSFKKSDKDKALLSSGLKIAPYLSLGLSVERVLKPGQWNGSAGAALKLGEQLGLALFMDKILKEKNKNRRSMTLAFYYSWRSFFSARMDISKSAHKSWIFKGGMESAFAKFLSLRLGGAWLSQSQKELISGGLAFNGPRLSLEYSVQTDQKDFQQAISLSFYF